jgi:RNA polymerase sigma factor (TIGR02999 family)
MSEATRLIDAVGNGDPHAAAQLLPLVYDELRRLARANMAHERASHTLQPTALVHEAYLRLVKDAPDGWGGRRHFFAAAAEAMRRILIENARHKKSLKAGGGQRMRDVEAVQPPIAEDSLDLLALDEALETLSRTDPRKAELVKLRFFVGLTSKEAAEALGISSSTADNDWAYARCWLKVEMEKGERPPG